MMKNKINNVTIITFALIFTVLAGCVPYTQRPQLNSLQIEVMQTRAFNVSKRVAFNAVVTVFQNLGYIVQTANYDTGFITAQSPTNTDFFGTSNCTKTTAFITAKTDTSTRIRINFVDNSTYSTNKGQLRTTDTPIVNAQSYINAFNKIRQQIFVSTGTDPVSIAVENPTTKADKTPQATSSGQFPQWLL